MGLGVRNPGVKFWSCLPDPGWVMLSHRFSIYSLGNGYQGMFCLKWNPPVLSVGMRAVAATLKKSMVVPPKAKNWTTLGSSNCTPRDFPKGHKNAHSMGYKHHDVYRNIINNSETIEVVPMSIHWWMEKEDVGYTHTHTYMLGPFFKKDFMYLFDRERERDQVGRQAEREEAGSPLSRQPDVGLDPRTLRSWPEPKSEA